MRSFAVFETFFKKGDQDHGYGILTPECFFYWLSTRKKMPKFPHDSYKRAILAHVRGADNRSPFPPKVERAILSSIRGGFLEGKSAWKAIYSTKVPGRPASTCPGKIHQRKVYGFHEVRRTSDTPGTLSAVSSDLLENLIKLHKIDLEESEKIASVSAIDASSPAVQYIMGKLGRSDPRLSPGFIIPPPDECYGRPDLPVHLVIGNLKDFTILECPEVLGSLASGLFCMHIFPTGLEFVAALVHCLPKLAQKRCFWVRNRYIVNGEVRVFFIRLEPRGDTLSYCFIQDQTEEWRKSNDIYAMRS